MGASSPVSNVSSAVLRRAFLGEAADMGGGKHFIAVNHPPSSAVRVSFDKLVLGLSAERVGAFWIDRKIRAESSAPRAVPSPELAARIVASLPGAVTYATPALVTPHVKVLTVEGKAPGSPGYPLTYWGAAFLRSAPAEAQRPLGPNQSGIVETLQSAAAPLSAGSLPSTKSASPLADGKT